MNISSGRKVVGGLIVAGLTVVATLAGTAAAGASPLDSPLVNSTCSFAQIDRALRAEHPDLAAKLDANPQRKARMQHFFNMPVPQRRAEIQHFMNSNPGRVGQMRQWESRHPQQVQRHRAVARQLADTCHNY